MRAGSESGLGTDGTRLTGRGRGEASCAGDVLTLREWGNKTKRNLPNIFILRGS